MANKKISRQDLQVIEAVLFASKDVLTQSKLNVCFHSDSVPILKDAVRQLQREYEKSDRAFFIENVAGGFRLSTRPEFAPWIQRVLTRAGKTPLSQAALETLAVVAYKGPASRAEIESIRGVNTAGVIRTLLDKKLVKISGRATRPGRPLLYSVTEAFLLFFGLNSTADLPKLNEMSELMGEGSSGTEFMPQLELAEDASD